MRTVNLGHTSSGKRQCNITVVSRPVKDAFVTARVTIQCTQCEYEGAITVGAAPVPIPSCPQCGNGRWLIPKEFERIEELNGSE